MIGSLLDSIKSEKELSLNHWRYKLLFWCWGEWPASPKESSLPEYLFSHYCPLFHLTNIILIFFPVILFFKIFMTAGYFGFAVAKAFANKIDDGLTWFIHWNNARLARKRANRPVEAPVELTEEQRKDIKRASYRRYLQETLESEPNITFSWIWTRSETKWYSQEEAEELFNTYVAAIKAKQDRANRRKAKIRAWVLFFVNFSQIFVKGALNLFYICLAAAVGYAVIMWGIPMTLTVGGWFISAFMYFMSVDWWYTSKVFSQYILGIGSMLGLLVALIYFLVWLKVPVSKYGTKCLVPAVALMEAGCSVIDYIVSVRNGILEFISVFYEENCPPIKIVSDVKTTHEE